MSVGNVVASDTGATVLSHAERRMWVLDQLRPGATDYLLPHIFRISGSLRPDALRTAIGELHRRHDVLRCTYQAEGGEPRRVLHPVDTSPLAFTIADFSEVAAEERDSRVQELLSRDRTTPFDLARDQPVRWLLIKLASTEHVLAMTVHHIAFDAWSGQVLGEELGVLYDAAVTGVAPTLPPVRVSYAEHAARENDRIRRGHADGSIAYWERTLDGVATLDLPLDHPRPPIWSSDGDSVELTVPPTLAAALTDLGRSAGATRFMTVLAAFTGLLTRLTGQHDLAVGTAVSGRDSEDTHDTVGLFVNTAVLRSSVDAETTFRELLRRTVTASLTAMEHQAVPFDLLVERLCPDRDLSLNPLFQTMISFEEAGELAITAEGLRFEEVEVPTTTVLVDLALALRRTADGGFTGHLDYATALFDRSSVERIADLFVRMIEQAVADPDRRLATLPLATVDEQLANLAYRPSEPVTTMTPATIRERARQCPDAVAVAGPDGNLDYATMVAEADGLAYDLAQAGVRRGDVVGVCVERGPHLVTALLGVMTSGAAVLWLNPEHPAERLHGILADAGGRLIIVGTSDGARLAGSGVPIMAADTARSLPDRADWRPPEVGPGDIAYIAYTSGSTGTPKGVQISHGALSEHLDVIVDEWRITADSRISLIASLGFDVSLEQILTALTQGARVVPLDPGRLSGDELLDGIRRHGVTHLNLTPIYYRELISRAAPRDRRLDSVTMLYVGADVIRGSDLQRWRDGAFAGQFVCGYGLTEATVTSTVLRTEDCTGRESALPLGQPVRGTRAYVLDSELQPVPIGIPGELYVGGRRIALGYRGRPAATANVFLPDPFSDEPGARMYRSGDLVCVRRGGILEYRGRVDRQIKVRGYRVEPAEVESVLLTHPDVYEAAVLHRPIGTTSEPGLVAFVVPKGPEIDDAAIREHLRERLPSYLVPAAIVTLTELPRTPNGKLDHTLLPAPALIRPNLDTEIVAPRTAAEAAVVTAMCEVLGIDEVGIHNNFFRLGGSSLIAARLVAQLRDHAGLVVPLRDVFSTPTAAALAARATPLESNAGAVLLSADRTKPLPLSAGQKWMCALHQMDASGREYVVPAVFRLRGQLDVGALREACHRLAERHEILRTRYVVVSGSGPCQIIDPAGAVPVEVVEPAGRSVEQILSEASHRGFDLAQDHQFRVVLVRVATDEHTLLLLTHHVAVDGRSWRIIETELAELYHALITGRPSELPAPPWQYADHGAREATRDLGDQVAFWCRTLAGSGPLSLPADRSRPEVRDPAGAIVSFRVPAEDARAVLDLGRAAGATTFATWFAIYSALLSRVSGQQDLVIGTPVDCRDEDGAESVLGSFVNTMAVRVPRVGDTFTAHLAAVRSLLVEAFDHREAPFDQVVAGLGRERDPSRTPLFDTMFQVIDDNGPALPLAGLAVEPVELLPPSALTDLTLAMRPNADGSWSGDLEYATALFEPATITRLGERLVRLVAAVAARPGAVLADIELHSAHEWAALDTTAPQTGDTRTVLDLFAAQVVRAPGAVAVTGPRGTMTYAELDRHGDRLARRLIAAGVKPGAAVAVCTGRGAWTVAALLAVLRCAAVYVPISESEPPDRRNALLDETSAVAVVTDNVATFAGAQIPVLVDDRPADDQVAVELPGVTTTDIAYVIFTSGSTGRPKGVVIDHGAFAHHCQVQAETYRLGPGERLALMASLSFDASMDQMMAPLICGASVVVLDARAVTPAQMLQEIHDHAVTVVDVTPVYFRELLRAARPGDRRLARLRLMSVGGDVVTGEDALGWHALGTDAEFGCTYGPTEATIACTFLVMDGNEARRAGRGPLPLGRPLPGSRLLVLDGAMRPVLPGAVGELFVGGRRVARGYLDRPDLTADRFVPDPLGPAGSRLYRTGDLVRRRADGVLQFLGRTDRQVKIRGFRVEPAEIESVLSALPGIRAAAVLPETLPDGQQGLLGFVVPVAGATLDATAILSAARDRLPRHLIPATLTIIDELPLTTTGKVDRARLPREEAAATATPLPYRALNATEREVARIWAEVIGASGIGPHDDFFDLGGHSLSAIRVGMRTQEVFGIELPLHQFLTATTVESLAAAIQRAVEDSLDELSDTEIVALAAQNLEAGPR